MFQLRTPERQELDMIITHPDGNNVILESIAIFQSPYIGYSSYSGRKYECLLFNLFIVPV